jgi:hypothetical protein
MKQSYPTNGKLKPFLVTNSDLKSLNENLHLPISFEPSCPPISLTLMFYKIRVRKLKTITRRTYSIFRYEFFETDSLIAKEVVESDLIDS